MVMILYTKFGTLIYFDVTHMIQYTVCVIHFCPRRDLVRNNLTCKDFFRSYLTGSVCLENDHKM